jgi:hypothetical protein
LGVTLIAFRPLFSRDTLFRPEANWISVFTTRDTIGFTNPCCF